MNRPQSPDTGVRTVNEREWVSASGVVPAGAAEVFDFLRRPANHSRLSGDRSVIGARSGPESLTIGDRFGMSMKKGLPYLMSSQVVEFEQDRLIAWRQLVHMTWRWEVEPIDTSSCQATETFDISGVWLPFLARIERLPSSQARNVEGSVRNLQQVFAGG